MGFAIILVLYRNIFHCHVCPFSSLDQHLNMWKAWFMCVSVCFLHIWCEWRILYIYSPSFCQIGFIILFVSSLSQITNTNADTLPPHLFTGEGSFFASHFVYYSTLVTLTNIQLPWISSTIFTLHLHLSSPPASHTYLPLVLVAHLCPPVS